MIFRRRYLVVAVDENGNELANDPIPPDRYWTRKQAESTASHLTVLASCRHPTTTRRPPLRYEVRERTA